MARGIIEAKCDITHAIQYDESALVVAINCSICFASLIVDVGAVITFILPHNFQPFTPNIF